MDTPSLYTASTWIIPVILAVTMHEAAHGWMAYTFSDSTARALGRITFNPIPHIDLFGTLLLPAMLLVAHSPVMFGYAKPVPVDFNRLRPKRIGMLATAAAGPGSNLLQALLAALLLHFGAEGWLGLNFLHAVVINCALAVFNMLPILPLDGGRVVRALLPGAIGRFYASLEGMGMVIVLLLLFLPPLHFVMEGVARIDQRLIIGLLQATGNGGLLE